MKRFLQKLKLIDFLDTELEITKSDFHKKLSGIVDETNIGFMSDFFDLFSSSKNEYKGYVDFTHFKLKRRKRLFEMGLNFPNAKGKVDQKGDSLIIKTEINAFKGIMVFFILFILLFYTIAIISMLTIGSQENEEVFIAIPFILIHACFMLGIPYLVLRRSVKRFKYDFERELYYLTKNNLSSINTHLHQ